jgi:hypothetical protein
MGFDIPADRAGPLTEAAPLIRASRTRFSIPYDFTEWAENSSLSIKIKR